MATGISIDGKFLDDNFADQLLTSMAKSLDRQMQLARTEIVLRTQRGQGYDNSSFKAYSPAYAAYRQRVGATEWLTLSGTMLGALLADSNRTGRKIEGRIYVSNVTTSSPQQVTGKVRGGAALVSARDKAFYNNKTRRFFGLSEKQKDNIVNNLVKELFK